MEEIPHIKSVLESLVFANGGPITIDELADAVGISKETVSGVLEEMRQEWHNRGIVLMAHDGMYQFGTHPDNAKFVTLHLARGDTQELSRAALETLAIVAYRGALPRSEIDYLRGVNSTIVLRNLIARGLVERVYHAPASTPQYQVSMDFLKHMGATHIEELPEYQKFRKDLGKSAA